MVSKRGETGSSVVTDDVVERVVNSCVVGTVVVVSLDVVDVIGAVVGTISVVFVDVDSVVVAEKYVEGSVVDVVPVVESIVDVDVVTGVVVNNVADEVNVDSGVGVVVIVVIKVVVDKDISLVDAIVVRLAVERIELDAVSSVAIVFTGAVVFFTNRQPQINIECSINLILQYGTDAATFRIVFSMNKSVSEFFQTFTSAE